MHTITRERAQLLEIVGEKLRSERGQTLVEYALILFFVSIVSIGALGLISGDVQTLLAPAAAAF